MLKILQARLQKFVNQSSPAFTPTWHPKSVSGFWAGPACSKKKKKIVNQELLDVPAGFRKGRGTRDQIANIHWIIE